MPIDRVGKSELPASGRLRQFARRVQSTAETTLVKYHNTIETIQPGKRPGLDSLESIVFLEGGTLCGTLHATGKLPQSVTCW